MVHLEVSVQSLVFSGIMKYNHVKNILSLKVEMVVVRMGIIYPLLGPEIKPSIWWFRKFHKNLTVQALRCLRCHCMTIAATSDGTNKCLLLSGRKGSVPGRGSEWETQLGFLRCWARAWGQRDVIKVELVGLWRRKLSQGTGKLCVSGFC